jgi:uncharacterized membrane protein YhaH (DUF805 family)
MNIFRFFFSPDGRIGGGAFFGGVLAIAAVEFLAALTREPLVMLGIAIAVCFPLFCLFAKRLHDMGLRAWPAGLFAVAEVAIAGLAFAFLMSTDAYLAFPWEPDKLLAMRELGAVGMILVFAVVACFFWGVVGPRDERQAHAVADSTA